jgi:alpha-beta hydrolase superfamily lysophospholipase
MPLPGRPRRVGGNTRRLTILACVLIGAALITLYIKGMRPIHPTTTLVSAGPAANRLIVVVKAGATDIHSYEPLVGRLLKEPELAGSDVLYFDHHVTKLAIGRLRDVATRLRAAVDAQWLRHGGYQDVILAGHSTGSLVMRAAYLESAGRDPREPSTVSWSDSVSRIVLLAGIGRGVDAEQRGRWSAVLTLGRLLPLLRSSVMYDVLRGADFVTNVRIAWIRYFAELQDAADRDPRARRPPMVVQMVGTEDDILRRDDNIDLEQFPTAFHIDVPGGGHTTLHRLDLSPNPELTYALFREAFVSPRPAHAAARRAVAEDTVKRVVLLLHGLRTSRDQWVHELAPMLRRQLRNTEVVESSYGWTSLLGFTLPFVRRRELRWLQDQYSERLARHPRAAFDVVAHSNGAYLVGQSLERVPAMRFRRVLLLGSVLPSDYSWSERREWRQADVVRADRATDDVIVAVFCNALHAVGMSDVGTSGWAGFDDDGVEVQSTWYPGGHAAALAPANLPSIAQFLADSAPGDIVQASMAGAASSRPGRAFVVLSRLAPWMAWFVVIGLASVLVAWLRRDGWTSPRRVGVVAAITLVVLIAFDVL